MERPKPGQQFGKAEPAYNDSELSLTHPTLHSYLTLTTWDDGTPRTTSTLLIFVDQGTLKLCLNDRDLNRSAFFSGTTLAMALADVETALCSGCADWRGKRSAAGGNGYTPF